MKNCTKEFGLYELILKMTSENPSQRPSMKTFVALLNTPTQSESDKRQELEVIKRDEGHYNFQQKKLCIIF
jgi:hypothetical protein